MKKPIFIFVSIFLFITPIAVYAHTEMELDYYELFEQHGSIMLIIDSQTGAIEHANNAAADFYGYTIEQLESMRIQEINTLTSEETEKEMQAATAEKGNYFVFKHRLECGDIRTVEDYSYPYQAQDKTLLVSIINDISDKTQLEEKNRIMTNVFLFALSGAVIIIGLFSFLLYKSNRKLKIKNHEINNFSELQRAFIDADNCLIYLKDESLKYVFINKAVENFYKKESSEIIGYDDFAITDEQFANIRRKTDLDVMEKMTVVVDEVKWQHRIFQTTKFPVKLLNGHYGVGAYVRDVTEEYNNKIELEKTNISLKTSEENIRLLLDSTAEGIYGIDTNGNCTLCNTSCLKLLGYKHQDELTGKNMHLQIHYKHSNGTELPLADCKIIKAFTKGEGTHVEDEVFWRADGTCFPVEYYSYPQFRDGEVVGAVVTFTDITERKLTQDKIMQANEQLEDLNKELQEKQYSLEEQNSVIEELNAQLEEENQRYLQQKEILQAIIDSFGAGIIMVNLSGKINFINKAWKEIFNYTDFGQSRHLCEDFYIDDDTCGDTEAFLQNMLTGVENNQDVVTKLHSLIGDSESRYAVDLEQTSPVKRFLNLYSNPCISYANHSFGRVFVIRDVSHQKEVDRLKLELISTVSHELRTPMSSILGFSELLLTRKLSEERNKEYISIINSEAKRLTDLINDFLDIQRMESGKQVFNKQFNCMGQIMEEAVKLFENTGDKHHIRYNKTTDCLPEIYCDKDKMLQVISNILSNAIKYSPDGGEIIVELLEENGKIRVSITDHGLGIPDDVKDKLFTKFYRVENDDRRKIGGSGLGLAICKEIIRAHGGEIGVESIYGQGSTFYFELPCSGNSVIEQAAEKVKKNSYGNKGDLLIVEDDFTMVKLIKEILKSEGLEMHNVSSGEEALEQMAEFCYKLVILDIALSGRMNGWDVLKELKSRKTTADIPIIISSVYENKEIASENDISDYLVKPFEPEQLIRVVQKALNGNLNSKMLVNGNGKLTNIVMEMLKNRGISVKQIEQSGNMLVITLDGEEGFRDE
ncbi:MAG: hypothetical protein APF77_05255 [Clostridia bacterium BRH_c25]|nr:MAG: hypothetical protein APF77_05255 [Clostridia bacterium BRH_c25]